MRASQTSLWARLVEEQPLAGIGAELVAVAGDPAFLPAVAVERETGMADIHPYRRKQGFKGRSNADGAKPYTKGSDGLSRRDGYRLLKEQGVHFFALIAKQVRRHSYEPAPLREVWIEKKRKPGEYRLIAIPTYIDRHVIEAVRQVLDRRVDPLIPLNQHGYRANSVGRRTGLRPEVRGPRTRLYRDRSRRHQEGSRLRVHPHR